MGKRIKLSLIPLLLSVVLIFCSCAAGDESSASDEGKKETFSEYSVEVRTEGKKPLAYVGVYVYKSDDLEDLVWAGETDKEGKTYFEASDNYEYVVVLKGVPEGYKYEKAFELKQGNNLVSVETELLDGDFLHTYKLGGVFGDYTITDYNGTVYKISELLETKKAIVLNFWFENCGPCRMEFPYMQASYEDYRDDIEIIAINCIDGTDESVAEYASQNKLTFPMAVGESAWTDCLGIEAMPTTVVIDRYGTVALNHLGYITDKETFDKIFEFFTADDYVQTAVRNISDIN